MSVLLSDKGADQAARMEKYYRLHARIYNLTRWSFLFGRQEIVRRVAALGPRQNILEIGCGTGSNTLLLAELFPEARITGVDVAAAMLKVAAKRLRPYSPRINLVHAPYSSGVTGADNYDLVLCSYALSMFNPGWEKAIADINDDMAIGGCFALVDFHNSSHSWFRRWMAVNHVRMEGHLLPLLEKTFQPRLSEIRQAYAGLWQWLLFVGQKERTSMS